MEERKEDRRNIWQRENQERIILMTPRDPQKGPTKEQIKAAAKAEGMSVNAWIIEAIRDKL